MAKPLKLAVAGAGGRMGRMLMRAVLAHPECQLVAAIDQPGSDVQGADAGMLAGVASVGLAVDSNPAKAIDLADGLLDFTVPEGSVALAKETAKRGAVHIVGTTGFSSEQERRFEKVATGARIVKEGNFSLGINLLCALTTAVAERLGPDYDIEVIETHHRHKIDAPSGTALMLGEAAASGRGIDFSKYSVRERSGFTGPRTEGAIGFSSIRAGEVIGEHRVMFGGATELLELKHVVSDRSLYADGALRAALWARDQAPGLYTMSDVLGL